MRDVAPWIHERRNRWVVHEAVRLQSAQHLEHCGGKQHIQHTFCRALLASFPLRPYEPYDATPEHRLRKRTEWHAAQRNPSEKVCATQKRPCCRITVCNLFHVTSSELRGSQWPAMLDNATTEPYSLQRRLPNAFASLQLAARSSGMILALGARGPGFNSQSSPTIIRRNGLANPNTKWACSSDAKHNDCACAIYEHTQ